MDRTMQDHEILEAQRRTNVLAPKPPVPAGEKPVQGPYTEIQLEELRLEARKISQYQAGFRGTYSD